MKSGAARFRPAAESTLPSSSGMPGLMLSDSRRQDADCKGLSAAEITTLLPAQREPAGLKAVLSSGITKTFHTLVAGHRRLLVKLDLDVGPVQFFVGHGPDSTAGAEAILQWWASAGELLRKRCWPQWPLVWLVNANARRGSIQSSAFGSEAEQLEDLAGQQFHTLLLEWNSCVPSTLLPTTDAGTWCTRSGEWTLPISGGSWARRGVRSAKAKMVSSKPTVPPAQLQKSQPSLQSCGCCALSVAACRWDLAQTRLTRWVLSSAMIAPPLKLP